MKELFKDVKKLEERVEKLEFQNANYRASFMLLYYAMKNEWVKELVEKSDIQFKEVCPSFKSQCTKEEILDYISHLKTIEKRWKINNFIKKIEDPSDKAFLLDEIIKAKKEV